MNNTEVLNGQIEPRICDDFLKNFFDKTTTQDCLQALDDMQQGFIGSNHCKQMSSETAEMVFEGYKDIRDLFYELRKHYE